MKTTIATAVSIAGVLVAGAGAFALNSAVLSASPQIESAMIPTAPTNASIVVENQKVITSTPETNNNTSVPTTDSPQSTNTYKVGDAGRIILALKDGNIEVVNILPSAGWTAKAPEYDDGEVEVNFRTPTMELEFTARVKNGQIEVYVESEHEDADESYEREDDEDDHDEHEDDD